MDNAFGRDMCLKDLLVIPVNNLVVYPAIEITGLNAVNDVARWCEFLM